MPDSLFIEGPAGAGKTTFAVEHIRNLLEQGEASEAILVLVPQRTLGRPYQEAFAGPEWPDGTDIDVVTLGGLARRGLETFWPNVATKAGFAHPKREPVFLTIETAQYYMARFITAAVQEGIFDSISITPNRIMAQTLDNLSKAAVNGFELDEIADRLISAWGDRHSSRPPVYRASIEIAKEFRAHCLQNNLLDFSLQIDVFFEHLLRAPVYKRYLNRRYRHLIVDNLEENFPVVKDFIETIWDNLETALLIFDTDGGYRTFLGSDPGDMHKLIDRCEKVETWNASKSVLPVMHALAHEFSSIIDPGSSVSEPSDISLDDGLIFASFNFYPQMLDGVVSRVADLVLQENVPSHEIAILVPFLSDSLRFSLTTRLDNLGIPAVSHRPSRAVRDEPAARAVLTLLSLAHPAWEFHPPVMDVADALQQVIDELDPVRAWLLAQIVYRPGRDALGSFDTIQVKMQERITYRAGEKYERLRQWLIDYESETDNTPPDHFLSRLFGEMLSQSGYGFHTNLDAGRVVAELVESARKFRQTLYPDGTKNWLLVSKEYFTLVQEGLLAALHVTSWQDEDKDAVFLAPAHTFLMRNRIVDYQFWLDAGSNYWWERLEQPLTHPYVLSRAYPAGQIWTDNLEFVSRHQALRRLTVGLSRRCRKKIFVAMSNLSEQGYEQRGVLLQLVLQIAQRYSRNQ